MKDSKICRICDQLAFIVLCLLMADCAALGSGRIFSVGSLGMRMILLGLLLVVSLPLMVQQFPRFVKNRILWLLVFFALWLGAEAVIGFLNGNSRSLLASDLKGFAYFVAVVPALCVLKTKQRVHLLMKVIMYASGVLATVALFLLLLYNTSNQLFSRLIAWDWEHHITMFAAVSSRIPRLFFKSTPYFLCGCAFPIYFAVTEKNHLRFWLYPAIAGLSLFAMLLSYTRSIYLAVGVAALFLLIVLWVSLDAAGRKRLFAVFGIAAAVFLLLLTLCSVAMKADYFGYALDRLGVTFYSPTEGPSATDPSETSPSETDPSETGPFETTDSTDPSKPSSPSKPGDTDHFQQATMQSDNFRAQTTAELTENILRSPVWGHGLGKALEVRDGYANEYIYHDILMKTGLIGLLLFLSPAIWLFADLIKKLKSKTDAVLLTVPWLTVLLGFLIFSYFNPYMNASLGILFYCCCISIVSGNQSKNHIQKEI